MGLKNIKVLEEDWERFMILRIKNRMTSRIFFKKILDVYIKDAAKDVN